jgi:curli production assembly/transport component CsgE
MHARIIATVSISLAMLCGTPVYAYDDGLDGLIINQTLTRFGQDFYNQFVKHWNEYQIMIPANLAVYERPSARWGSQIWIEYRGRRIFQRNVGPSMRAIDELANQAAARTFNLMLQEQSLFNGGKDAIEADDIY